MNSRDNAEVYDNGRELTEYIWRNYRQLVTEAEARVMTSAVLEEKAQHSGMKMAEQLHERSEIPDDLEIKNALKDGTDVFRARVRDRILKESGDAVHINRCSECERIVATPRARQCLWCGYDWHETQN